MHAAQAFNNEQAKLQLDQVLSQGRLATLHGTNQSLAVLEQLVVLTRAHKEAFNKLVIATSSELATALADMPVHLREEYRAKFIETVNWQLNAQSGFYINREKWIAAAFGICKLIESRRQTATFSENGVDFANDEDLVHFSSLLAIIEETHNVEVAQLNERLIRLASSAHALGLRPAK